MAPRNVCDQEVIAATNALEKVLPPDQHLIKQDGHLPGEVAIRLPAEFAQVHAAERL